MTGHWLASFATPTHDVALRRAQARHLLVEDAQLQMQVFLRTHSSAISERSAGLVDFLAGWAESETVSHAEVLGIPIAQECWRREALDPVWVAASSALHLAAAGRPGDWTAAFLDPLPLRTRLAVTRPVLGVSCTQERLELAQQDGSTVVCQVDALGQSVLGIELTRVEVGPANLFIMTPGSQLTFPIDPDLEEALELGQSIDGIRQTVAEALGRLRDFAPQYFDWVAEVVHTLAPRLPPSADGYSSSSGPSRPGVVHVSFPISTVALMESLVHEASHQYYHLCLLETLFGNGRDERLYLNPYIAKERPIERILIAFHAFSNIVLFYRSYLGRQAGTEPQDDLGVHVERL